MPRSRRPQPTLISGDRSVSIRHHEDNERIGRIIHAPGQVGEGEWLLEWDMSDLVSPSRYPDAPSAVRAAVDLYPTYLEAVREWMEKEYGSQDRAVRLQARAVARAVSTPTGGQKGWRPAPAATLRPEGEGQQ